MSKRPVFSALWSNLLTPVMNWFFSLFFILLAILSIGEGGYAAGAYILLGLFLLPPGRKYVYGKTGVKLHPVVRGVIIIVLILSSTLGSPSSEKQKLARKSISKAEQHVELVSRVSKEFEGHKDQILAEAQNLIEVGHYQEAVYLADKYTLAESHKLQELRVQAKNMINIKRTKEILSELKEVPSSEYRRNKSLYEELLNITPDNESYRKKYNLYSDKLRAKEVGEKIAKYAISPITRSGYPKTYAKWGRKNIKKINELLEPVALFVASSNECDRLDLVELSGNRSEPPEKIVFFADCENGKRFYVSEDDLNNKKKARSQTNKMSSVSDMDAITSCIGEVKGTLLFPSSFNHYVTSNLVYRAPTAGNVVVTFNFNENNGLGNTLPRKARCVLDDRGIHPPEISNR